MFGHADRSGRVAFPTRRGVLRSVAALAGGLPSLCLHPASAMAKISIMSALEFVETLGVNTHIAYTDSQYDNMDVVLNALRFLGLYHVRDAPPSPRIDATWRGHYDIAARAGLHFNFVVDATVPPAEMIDIYRDFARKHPTTRFTIEGPNEVNNWPVRFGDLSGDMAAVAYQRALYRLAKVTPELAAITVLSATGMPQASDGDWANYHSYPWRGEQPYPTLRRELRKQTEFMAGRPVALTETGYYTLMNDTKAWGGVDEATQAKLVLNTYLDAVRLGVVRTYIYQLLDAYTDSGNDQPEHHFGLFRRDASPKPAALAIRHLVAALRDEAPDAGRFPTSPPEYSLSGMPADGASLLLTHSNGDHSLLLWNEAEIWNGREHRPVAPAPVQVELRLAVVHDWIEVFDPLLSSTPIRAAEGRDRIVVSLAGAPVILRLRQTA